jgi:hypothetical protein
VVTGCVALAVDAHACDCVARVGVVVALAALAIGKVPVAVEASVALAAGDHVVVRLDLHALALACLHVAVVVLGAGRVAVARFLFLCINFTLSFTRLTFNLIYNVKSRVKPKMS